MVEEITYGYKVPDGDKITGPISHLVVTGQTQEAGKTTALESYIRQTDKKAIVFLTKKGEEEFTAGRRIRPYFSDQVDWEYVKNLLEATMSREMRLEESWIINAVEAKKYPFLEPAETLGEVMENVSTLLERHRDESDTEVNLRSMSESIYTSLEKYLEKVVPRIQELDFTQELDLQPGINIVDLREMEKEVQSLVISRTIQKIYDEETDTIVVLPEAWKFLPQQGGNPCKDPVEQFIREGATNNNYIWIDSQDISGTDKTPLKQVKTWILGMQREKNEVERTRDQMPMPKRQAPGKEEIMNLKIGHFYFCGKDRVVKIYVKPEWMDDVTVEGLTGDELAQNIAKGEIDSETIKEMVEEGELDIGSSITVADKKEESESVETGKEGKNWKEIAEKRAGRVDQLEERVESLKEELDLAQKKLEREETVAETETGGLTREEVVEILKEKLGEQSYATKDYVKEQIQNVETGQPLGSPIEDVQDEILKDFQEDAVNRIMAQTEELTDHQKNLLLFIESKGSHISSKKAWVKNALGWDSYGSEIREQIDELVEQGFVRKDKGNNFYPDTIAKVENELSEFKVEEETVKQTYDKVLAELKTG